MSAEEILPPPLDRQATQERAIRVRRLNASEFYVQVFEKAHRESGNVRVAFKLFTGIAAYLHIAAAIVLATAAQAGYARMYVAVLPLLMLSAEIVAVSIISLLVAIPLAAKAEICQVWRQVLTTNASTVLASILMLFVFVGLYRDLQQDEAGSHWALWPVSVSLLLFLTKNLLVMSAGSQSNIVVSLSALLSIIMFSMQGSLGITTNIACTPAPIALMILITLRFRDVGMTIKRHEHTCISLAIDALALAGYGILLLPALEATALASMNGGPGQSNVPSISAIPIGALLLCPAWVRDLGEWAEDVAFGFLIV